MKLSNAFSVLAVTVLLAGCGMQGTGEELADGSNNDDNKPIPVTMANVETVYESLDSITADSDLVAEVSINSDAKQIDYQGAVFVTHELKVKDVIVGEQNLKNETIKLLEVGLSPQDLNIVKNNSKYVVFLKKYEGPVTDNAYVVTGVYQGKFKVNQDESLEYSGTAVDGVNLFQGELVKKNKLKDFKVKIKKAKEKSKG